MAHLLLVLAQNLDGNYVPDQTAIDFRKASWIRSDCLETIFCHYIKYLWKNVPENTWLEECLVYWTKLVWFLPYKALKSLRGSKTQLMWYWRDLNKTELTQFLFRSRIPLNCKEGAKCPLQGLYSLIHQFTLM